MFAELTQSLEVTSPAEWQPLRSILCGFHHLLCVWPLVPITKLCRGPISSCKWWLLHGEMRSKERAAHFNWLQARSAQRSSAAPGILYAASLSQFLIDPQDEVNARKTIDILLFPLSIKKQSMCQFWRRPLMSFQI